MKFADYFSNKNNIECRWGLSLDGQNGQYIKAHDGFWARLWILAGLEA